MRIGVDGGGFRDLTDAEAAAMFPPAPAPTQADLLAYAAAKRYAIETGGYVYSGHPIATDETSQAKIGNAALGAMVVGSAFATDWKCSDGVFFPLDQAAMMAMATAVFAFVNACYAKEQEVDAAIAAGTIATFADVDGVFGGL